MKVELDRSILTCQKLTEDLTVSDVRAYGLTLIIEKLCLTISAISLLFVDRF